jgi:hypothetical protein
MYLDHQPPSVDVIRMINIVNRRRARVLSAVASNVDSDVGSGGKHWLRMPTLNRKLGVSSSGRVREACGHSSDAEGQSGEQERHAEEGGCGIAIIKCERASG